MTPSLKYTDSVLGGLLWVLNIIIGNFVHATATLNRRNFSDKLFPQRWTKVHICLFAALQLKKKKKEEESLW